MKKKIEQLIKALDGSLKTLSNAYMRYCMYSIYEDLLLLTSVEDEAKVDQLYRHINKYLKTYFGSASSKLSIEEKEEYTNDDYRQILHNVERAIKKVF